MDFPKIKQSQKKSISAVNALLPVIARYNVGDKLPPERQLALEMAISRNTLREAIAALQVMGVIEVRHSQGNFIVKLPDLASLSCSLDNIFDPQKDPIALVEARVAFEPGAAFVAALHCTDADKKILQENYAQIEYTLSNDNLDEYSKADSLFHINIARATHNEIIVETIAPMIEVLRTPLWQAMKIGLKQTFREVRTGEHKAILFNILNAKPLEASIAMREHLLNSKERFLHERE